MALDVGAPSPEELHRRKLEWVRSGHPGPIPSNVDWIDRLDPDAQRAYAATIRRKPTRTRSGVAIVAVMTAPSRCPHGRCTYCPGGVDLGSPQSYTGEEPSALRGAQFGYDPRAITEHRLATLQSIGHPTSKVEAIVMGGTFTSRPAAYQTSVVKGIFDGANGTVAPSLEEAHRVNEGAARRIVSLTVETRPDRCDPATLDSLLLAGVTRIEIGVECLRDPVLSAVNRAHDVATVIAAARRIRDRGLKLAFHMMPGLPGMDPGRDTEDFARLFDDPTLRPDMLKIYPTLVLPGTPLYDDWKAGRYTPYGTEEAVALLATVKAKFPPWVRVQRIQRDIPARLIAAGVRAGNLRQMVHRRMESVGTRCRCLRCRETGRRATPDPSSFEIVEREYSAGAGTEHFLAFESVESDTLGGFLRLRVPGGADEGGLSDPVIRELKVVGAEVPVGREARDAGSVQHRGLGRSLVGRAEEIARTIGARRLLVTSAVGTREYYRRLGFEPAGAHFAKPLFP